MQRKPWFRESDGWWYGQVGAGRGRRRQQRIIQGAGNEKKAIRLYKRMIEDGSASDLSGFSKVRTICKAFLRRHSKKKCAPETHAWYRYYLKSFCKKYGSLRVSELRPLEAEAWLDATDWNDTTRNRAVTCIKVAFNWAVRMGVLKESPLRNLEKPPMGRRERILTREERKTLFGGIRDKAFKVFVFALVSTGARPSEIRRVTTAELLPGMWVFSPKKHKTGHKTMRPRVVYLTPPMMKLCERLAKLRQPGEPLFFNSREKPWTSNAIRCRFRYLRERLPALAGVTAYCCRHSFVSDGLEKGIPLATMAELTGHTSTRMIEQHYAHLNAKVDHMRAAAATASRPHHPRPGEA